MMEKNHGHIVAMSSMAGIVGLRNLVPYCATKFAVRGLMEALHEELREDKTKDYSGVSILALSFVGLCHLSSSGHIFTMRRRKITILGAV